MMPDLRKGQALRRQTLERPSPEPQLSEQQSWVRDVEAMCKRLSDARATVINDLFACVSDQRRAEIAMHCFSRGDLKESAYEIARTCERKDLHDAGDAMGEVLYALSRSA